MRKQNCSGDPPDMQQVCPHQNKYINFIVRLFVQIFFPHRKSVIFFLSVNNTIFNMNFNNDLEGLGLSALNVAPHGGDDYSQLDSVFQIEFRSLML